MNVIKCNNMHIQNIPAKINNKKQDTHLKTIVWEAMGVLQQCAEFNKKSDKLENHMPKTSVCNCRRICELVHLLCLYIKM